MMMALAASGNALRLLRAARLGRTAAAIAEVAAKQHAGQPPAKEGIMPLADSHGELNVAEAEYRL